jgi:riboflavin kinase/FMN adenylyltransferase
MGASELLLCPFDKETAQTDAAHFIEALVAACQPLGFISVGYEWAFGKGRSGDIHRLMELGRHHDFAVCGVPSVRVDGQVVSSTLIREAVRKGDLATAKTLLGRSFALDGIVVKGKQLGRQIGFPTANIALDDVELPPDGVYAVRAEMQDKIYLGVANLGLRPTVEANSAARTFEVYLLDPPKDEFYGQRMDVQLVQQLRGEQKFQGLEALKAQIAKDVAQAREVLEIS